MCLPVWVVDSSKLRFKLLSLLLAKLVRVGDTADSFNVQGTGVQDCRGRHGHREDLANGTSEQALNNGPVLSDEVDIEAGIQLDVFPCDVSYDVSLDDVALSDVVLVKP